MPVSTAAGTQAQGLLPAWFEPISETDDNAAATTGRPPVGIQRSCVVVVDRVTLLPVSGSVCV